MWFITSIIDEKKLSFAEKINRRTFGYFPIIEALQTVIARNEGDFHEELYDYLVCEEIPFGIHPGVTREIWYKWQSGVRSPAGFDQGKWVSCDKPDFSVGTTNWALG